jgi:hypothetical protein
MAQRIALDAEGSWLGPAEEGRCLARSQKSVLALSDPTPAWRFLRDFGAWSTRIRRVDTGFLYQTEQRMSSPTLSWEERCAQRREVSDPEARND